MLGNPPGVQVHLTVRTPHGPGGLVLDRPSGACAAALLFHGAGGGIDAAVLLGVRDALTAAGIVVARFEQPYRVAGRRAPDPAPRLDAAALAAVEAVRRRRGLGEVPLVLAGKSSGARVACRVAARAGAVGVVALGFPLHPPGRPDRSRRDELAAAGVPVLVLQGSRDPFGTPDELCPLPPDVALHAVVGGDHSFAARRADCRTTAECLAEVAAAAAAWARARIDAADRLP